tara:strand:- start:1337 stop:2263 length:927 start_codon:yes stop_codon:yes gene_type:complete
MMQKVPNGLRDPQSGQVYRYTKKSALKYPNYKVLFDDYSGRFEGREMASIGSLDVTKMTKVLRVSRGLSPDGINNYLKYLRAAMHYAEDHLEVVFDKKPKIKAAKGGVRQRYMTSTEARSLIKYLDPLRADMVQMALSTGQRNSNIRKMRWDWINSAMTELCIPMKDTKNNEVFRCFLNKDAQKILQKRAKVFQGLSDKYPHLRGKLKHVFVQSDPQHLGTTLADGVMTKGPWKKALLRAGLPSSIVFHSCRHTFASWHLSSGTQPKQLMEVGGWKSVASMDGYMHMVDGQKKEVSRRLEGMLERIDG